MNKKLLVSALFFLSVCGVLPAPSHAVTTVVDISELMDWRIVDFSATDSTHPATVYFTLRFNNNGTVDLNVSGNLIIKKDGSVIYNNSVFEDNVSAQGYRNFTFSWVPTTTGDFFANLTINMTNVGLGEENLIFTATSFTVYSPPSGPSGTSETYTIETPLTNITRTWDKILPGTPVIIEIDNKVFAFTSIIIEVTKESNNVNVEVNRIYDKPVFVKKDPPGKIYQYVEMKHVNMEGNIENAIINFKVENEWILSNNIDKSRLYLNRYTSNTDEWESFKASIIKEDSEYSYYIMEIPELSIFSITGIEKTTCIPGGSRCSVNDLQECSSEGSWETVETCEYGCDSEKLSCKLKGTTCEPGERGCEGNVLRRCSSDGMAWETIETCDYQCINDECTEKPAHDYTFLWYIGLVLTFVLFIIIIIVVLMIMTGKTIEEEEKKRSPNKSLFN